MPAFFPGFQKYRFIREFRKGMRAGWSPSGRLDELPYFVTWPLVYILRHARFTPNQLALISFLSGLGFAFGIFRGYYEEYPVGISFLLFARILLDCADGQLARYTDQTSNLGALYDLVADFLFSILLYAALAYFLTTHFQIPISLVIPIILLAFFAFISSTTIFSFVSLAIQSPDGDLEDLKNRFVAPLPNDRLEKPIYSAKLSIFNRLFQLTWRPVSLLIFYIILKRKLGDISSRTLLLLSPFEYGVQLSILAFLMILGINPIYFLIMEIAGFFILILLLRFYRRTI